MPTALEAKLFAAAQAYPGFSILGTSPFRWYDLMLREGSAFPAIVAQVIDNPKTYSYTAPVLTSWYRVQFTIWALPDSAATNDVLQVLLGFLVQFNAVGIPRLGSAGLPYPNLVLNNRPGIEERLEPPVYKRIVDVRVYNNDSL